MFTLTPASVMRSSTDAHTMHNVPSCNSAPLSMYFRIGTPAANAYAPTMYKMPFAS